MVEGKRDVPKGLSDDHVPTRTEGIRQRVLRSSAKEATSPRICQKKCRTRLHDLHGWFPAVQIPSSLWLQTWICQPLGKGVRKRRCPHQQLWVRDESLQALDEEIHGCQQEKSSDLLQDVPDDTPVKNQQNTKGREIHANSLVLEGGRNILCNKRELFYYLVLIAANDILSRPFYFKANSDDYWWSPEVEDHINAFSLSLICCNPVTVFYSEYTISQRKNLQASLLSLNLAFLRKSGRSESTKQ